MSNYPLPNFHFQVQWGGTRIDFIEVSGLNIEYDVIESRGGSSPQYNAIKMPGLEKFTNVVLKRGIVEGDTDFFKWINTINMNIVDRRDVIISLLDEGHNPVMVWKVKSAWPVKYTGPVLNARGHEVAVEVLELAHEGITLVPL